MSIWETLGIEPTDDLGAVRRAFAAKTRDCHPEEDQEGFQRLHEAYETALVLARGMGGRPRAERAHPRAVSRSLGTGQEEALDFQQLLRAGRGTGAPKGATPAQEAPLDISAHISKGLEEGREQEAHRRRRRAQRMLAELDELAAGGEAADFYPRWKRCLGSVSFQTVMLEEDFLQGLEGRLAKWDRLPEGGYLGLYLAYGFGRDDFFSGHPQLGVLYDGLSRRIPAAARRETESRQKTGQLELFRLCLSSLWKKVCWLAVVAALTILPGQLPPELGYPGAVLFALVGPLVLWAGALLLRRARIRRWPERRLLSPLGRGRHLAPALLTALEMLLLYVTAGRSLQSTAADAAAQTAMWAVLLLVCAIPPALVLILSNDYILLDGEGLTFSVPTAPYGAATWDRVVAVRRRPFGPGHQLLFLLADGSSVRLLAERYEGHRELVEATRQRGLLF